MIQNILIRGTNWIGDAIMTFPAITFLKGLFPSAHLDIMARPWVAQVYKCHQAIRQVIVCQPGSGLAGRMSALYSSTRKIRCKGYEMGIVLPNSFESALVFKLAGIPNILGYCTDLRRILLDRAVPVPGDKEDRHHVFYYLDLVRNLARDELRVDPSVLELGLSIPSEEKEKARHFLQGLSRDKGLGKDGLFVGFNPGAAYGPAKCWPVLRFRQLSRLLLAKFSSRLHILIFGTHREEKIAEQIRQEDPERLTNLCGKTTLMEAISLIRELDLLVTNDSGLMHVGAACSVPLVAIFGSTNPVATGPWSKNATIISHDLDCAPCKNRTCTRQFQCMLGISAEEVFQVCRDKLSFKVEGLG